MVYAHPRDTSYAHAVLDRVTSALGAGGSPVTVLDLCADGFDPVASSSTVHPMHLDALRRAGTLVVVHPTWWSGQPAILTGWLAALPQEALRTVTRVVTITTHGSPRWVNLLEGRTGRDIVRRVLRPRYAPGARVEWIALYGLDRIDEEARRRFLDRVERVVTPR